MNDKTFLKETIMNYKYKRVILIGVDGAGVFFEKAETPFMDRIFENGATSYSVLTAKPTISAECWGSMLIGSSAKVHGLTNEIVDSRTYDLNSDLPSVFRRIREVMPDASLASFTNWSPINHGIIEHNLGVVMGDDGNDEVVTDLICDYLKDNNPTFLFVQFDDVDGAGHGNGYGSERHLQQITTTDGFIERIYNAVAAHGGMEDTLFIVTADHGGTYFSNDEGHSWGGHGGWTDEEKYIFFGAAGKTVKKGTIGDMNVRDIVAIVLHALGIEIPDFDIDGFSAQIPENVFTDVVPAVRQSLDGEPFEHETVPTPEKGSGAYITDVLDSEKLETVLHFDGSAEDALGKTKVTVIGKPKYYNVGYHSSCIEIGKQGYLELPELKLGKESFSASLWFYHDGGITSDPPLYGTKEWTIGICEGFTLACRENDFQFNTGDGEHVYDMFHIRPGSISRGWINSILIVDREKNEITHYFNFSKKMTRELPEPYCNLSFDNYPFRIGEAAEGNYNNFNFMVDDFIFYRGVFTDEDVKNLAKYYNYEI